MDSGVFDKLEVVDAKPLRCIPSPDISTPFGTHSPTSNPTCNDNSQAPIHTPFKAKVPVSKKNSKSPSTKSAKSKSCSSRPSKKVKISEEVKLSSLEGDSGSVSNVLMKFDALRRRLLQAENEPNKRPDLRAGTIMMNNGFRTNTRKRIGSVPGVEIGDVFYFRIETCLVGLHAPIMVGIDYMVLKDEPVAVSIVSSGGYEDDDVGDGKVLIYTGQGGNASSDQKLERGNLALEKSLHRGNEVRVLRGVKDVENPNCKVYIYDGLYKIQESWTEKSKMGAAVFKYKLVRIPGQDEAFTIWKSIQTWRESSIGCSCQGTCVPDSSCSCIQALGGDAPYTNGVLVIQKSVVHECGPSCSCYPDCSNQVLQNGVKIRLEVFQSKDKGWGLRSWDPIRAGTFICEYAGEVVDKDNRGGANVDDEYTFNTTNKKDYSDEWNYVPVLLEEERPVELNEKFKPSSPVMISAKKMGNVARFMNHSCSPNVIWQLVLEGRSKDSFPHIMFYARKHIPPLTELTYKYVNCGLETSSLNGRLSMLHFVCFVELKKKMKHTYFMGVSLLLRFGRGFLSKWAIIESYAVLRWRKYSGVSLILKEKLKWPYSDPKPPWDTIQI